MRTRPGVNRTIGAPPLPVPEEHRPAFGSTNGALTLEWQWLLELAKETSKLKASQRYRDWLNATADHWEYSPFNRALIAIQKRDAVRVAGRLAWEARGRRVRPGAPPITILAPTGGRRFVGVVVYDLADTEGPPLAVDDWGLKGSSAHVDAARSAAAKLRIRLSHVAKRRGATGWAKPGRIVEICRGLSAAEEVATLAHEYGHVLLGHLDERQTLRPSTMEGEAEAVAYVVLRSLGSRSKAPAYLLFHGVTASNLRHSFKLIGDAAHRIAGAILGRKKRREPEVAGESPPDHDSQ